MPASSTVSRMNHLDVQFGSLRTRYTRVKVDLTKGLFRNCFSRDHSRVTHLRTRYAL
jgi:hypothetical protein